MASSYPSSAVTLFNDASAWRAPRGLAGEGQAAPQGLPPFPDDVWLDVLERCGPAERADMRLVHPWLLELSNAFCKASFAQRLAEAWTYGRPKAIEAAAEAVLPATRRLTLIDEPEAFVRGLAPAARGQRYRQTLALMPRLRHLTLGSNALLADEPKAPLALPPGLRALRLDCWLPAHQQRGFALRGDLLQQLSVARLPALRSVKLLGIGGREALDQPLPQGVDRDDLAACGPLFGPELRHLQLMDTVLSTDEWRAFAASALEGLQTLGLHLVADDASAQAQGAAVAALARRSWAALEDLTLIAPSELGLASRWTGARLRGLNLRLRGQTATSALRSWLPHLTLTHLTELTLDAPRLGPSIVAALADAKAPLRRLHLGTFWRGEKDQLLAAWPASVPLLGQLTTLELKGEQFAEPTLTILAPFLRARLEALCLREILQPMPHRRARVWTGSICAEQWQTLRSVRIYVEGTHDPAPMMAEPALQGELVHSLNAILPHGGAWAQVHYGASEAP